MKNAAGGTKSFNVGLGLLKIWLCYEVVLTHLAEYAVPEVPVLAKLRDYAVPAFMLMTFFFSARSFAACAFRCPLPMPPMPMEPIRSFFVVFAMIFSFRSRKYC
jgi:hypothetical protein